MEEQEDGQRPDTVIVKKIKKIERPHAHGGSWKVAYADFVTAMMALFLLMWLISMVPQVKREQLQGYLETYNLFEPSGKSLDDKGPLVFKEAGIHDDSKSGDDLGNAENKKFVAQLKQDLRQVQEHLVIEMVDDKVRIHLVDKEGEPMFPLGSTEPGPIGRRVIKMTAQSLLNTPYRIAVEGHTDAVPFTGGEHSNWELSTLRAAAARKELENFGFDPRRFDRVVGYADTIPLIESDPYDPQNRRISLLLLPEERQETVRSRSSSGPR